MLYVVISFLWLSILLYLLLGGADFGAGIVELFTAKKRRQNTRILTYNTIGPVWEANHMWLIIAVVILFVGFPTIYTVLSVHLHIPLVLMLLGIAARGTAFIFRHYDAVKDNMQSLYNAIFMHSSYITPLFLGVIAGAVIGGKIDPEATDFYKAYIYPWFNLFSLSTGLFTIAICGFLAAVYLSGEDYNQEGLKNNIFIKKARHFNVATVIAGGFVFVAAEIENVPLVFELLTNAVTLAALVLASLSLILLWWALRKEKTPLARILAGFQITMILFAIGYLRFPDFVFMANNKDLSLFETAAMGGPIDALGWALIVGSVFILPSLFYLVYSFQKK